MKKILLAIITLVLFSTMLGLVSAEQSPNLNFSVSTYAPLPAEPGKPLTVWVNVQNIGGEATNINVEFQDTPAFRLLNDRDRSQDISVLGTYSDYLLKYEVFVADDAPVGSRDLMLQYTMDGDSNVYNIKIPIDVKSAEAPISVSSVSMDPKVITPGNNAKLTVAVKNLAKSSNVRDVQVALYLEPVISSATVVTDLPFISVNSNKKSIDRIVPGQTSEFNFELMAYPEAESKIYKLPVIISYKDDFGNNYSTTYLVGVQVNSKPELLLNIESSTVNKNSAQGEVVFNVINKGVNNMKLMTITLNPSEDYEVADPSNTVYLGKVDSDDFQSAKFNVMSKAQEVIKYNVTLEYRDALNNEFTDNRIVEYTLREPANGGGGSPVVTIIIVLLIAAGIFFWVRKRKKNKESKE